MDSTDFTCGIWRSLPRKVMCFPYDLQLHGYNEIDMGFELPMVHFAWIDYTAWNAT